MCLSIAKCGFILLNVIFLILGLAFAVVGGILAFAPGIFFSPVYDSVKSTVGNTGLYSIPDSADEMADLPLVHVLGIGLFALGIILFLISFTGCCGSCYAGCKCLLIVFVVLVIIFMIAEIVLGTMFYVTNSPLHDNIRSELKTKITDDYSEQGSDAFSMAINLVNQYFDCCGIDGGSDFGAKPHRSCDAQYETTGCYSKLTNLIQDNIIWAGVALAALLLLQLLEAIFAIVLYKDNKVFPV